MTADTDKIVRIDIAELAVRIAEVLTSTARPDAATPTEALKVLPDGERERYVMAAKIAAGYCLECIRAAERMN